MSETTEWKECPPRKWNWGFGGKARRRRPDPHRAGDARLVLAGGFESMSNVPYYVRGLRGGVKFGDRKVEDGLIHDGLWCSFGRCHMGGHAEYTAAKAGVTRREADQFALDSHRKAVQAIADIRELAIDPDVVNVRGGAVALGHPIGASGARILVTLLGAMESSRTELGLATLCLGAAARSRSRCT